MPRGGTPQLPPLPAAVEQKLTKTGYTRGATVREIYQNRVTRNNPVLIPWSQWPQCRIPDDAQGSYENGYIVLVEPPWYFESKDRDTELASEGLELGVNALLLYRRRAEWRDFHPSADRLPNGKPFQPATSRTSPLGGVYFARIHATVSDEGFQVTEGFATNRLRGAGIRVYEYASATTITRTRLQLECLVWHCYDAEAELKQAGMTGVASRRDTQLARALDLGLLDVNRLCTFRILNEEGVTICPLCMKSISAADFLKRTEQAEGRETYDLTTTEVSLFHIRELRVGRLQHKPYNLGWGHHFCNVVTKDAGIMPTLKWMSDVLSNQPPEGFEDQEHLVEEAVDR